MNHIRRSPFSKPDARISNLTNQMGTSMSLLQFSQLAEIVGVIAVIGSLIYVGFQLKQNTTALHGQSRQSVLVASQAELFKAIDIPEVGLAITKKTELTREETMILNNWYTAVMRARMFAWLQYRDRIIDKEQWDEELLVVQLVFSSLRGRRWWERVGSQMFTSAYVQLVNDALSGQIVSDDLYEMQASWSGPGSPTAIG